MKYCIIIPPDINYDPSPHEMFAARMMTQFFHSDVIFIKRHNTAKSADFKINNTIWEIKSPTGNSRRTMQNNLRNADDQSANIIINLVRCKMETIEALNRLKYELKKAHKVKKLIVILKNGNVLVLK